MQDFCPNRRRLIKAVGFIVPTISLPAIALPASSDRTDRGPHRLTFYHQHTREELDIVYRDTGVYRQAALEQIDWLLRDFRTGEAHPIDPELLNFLHAIRAQTNSVSEIEIVSGFRSPKTNAMLRNQTNGVAKRSFHMRGKAIDIRLTDVPIKTVREAALELRRGGVGYYPKSNFVHLDTGRARNWQG